MNAEPPERLPLTRFLTCLLLLAPLGASAQDTAPGTLSTAIPSFALPTAAVLTLLVLLNGVFVAAGTAIELLRPAHVKMHENGVASRLQAILDAKVRSIAACSLASQTLRAWMIILCFVPAPFIANSFAKTKGIDDAWWHILAAGVITTIPVAAINAVIGELVPRSLAALYPHRIALRTKKVVGAATLLLSAPSLLITSAANLISRRFGAVASFSFPNQAEHEIRSLVETAQETGEIEQEEKDLLHSVFEFSDTVVREVMTPRVDVDAVSVNTPPDELIQLIQDSGHSRIPIFEETDDQIIGIIHAKDLMLSQLRKNGKPVNLRTLLRPAFFVPENKDLHDLLREMRMHRTQMAIVQDEFGGTAGIVTIEDIVEELVGDIIDEYDTEEKSILSDGDGWIIQGRTNVYDVNEATGSTFETDEFDTIGGYVFGLFGRQPKEQEVLEDNGFRFTVVETDGRRISRLKLERDNSLFASLDEALG
ncbi:MAG: HlyC/CorC family transporter [Chthonomonas sp.]|nr:HlyC/CorC family transporter [Chthonomonas sp.]